jgi:hypothetical protein
VEALSHGLRGSVGLRALAAAEEEVASRVERLGVALAAAEAGLDRAAPADIERQIERYFVTPGQALAYKIGMIKILELRERARESLGADFDIRRFHDLVLKNGAMPMAILEEVIGDYVDENSRG